MLILGIILIIVGYLLGIGIIETIGWILAVIGLLLLVLGFAGHSVGGRRWWY
jgi:hypothetical protein